MKKYLARILEFSKAQKSFADTERQRDAWETVVCEAFNALGHPSMQEIDRILERANNTFTLCPKCGTPKLQDLFKGEHCPECNDWC